MTQAALFRTGPAYPLARSGDPLSSFESAERAREFVATHEQRILAVLRASGVPMTAHEIGARCGLNNVQVLRRMGAIAGVTKDERGHVCRVTGRRLETFEYQGGA